MFQDVTCAVQPALRILYVKLISEFIYIGTSIFVEWEMICAKKEVLKSVYAEFGFNLNKLDFGTGRRVSRKANTE